MMFIWNLHFPLQLKYEVYMLVIIMEIIHLQDHCKSIGQWIAKSVVKTTVQVQHYLEKEIIIHLT